VDFTAFLEIKKEMLRRVKKAGWGNFRLFRGRWKAARDEKTVMGTRGEKKKGSSQGSELSICSRFEQLSRASRSPRGEGKERNLHGENERVGSFGFPKLPTLKKRAACLESKHIHSTQRRLLVLAEGREREG